MKTILLSRDLLFISRVREVAAARGQQALVVKSMEALREALASLESHEKGVLLLDLEKSPLPAESVQHALSERDPSAWRCISFYSHVHVETAQAAKSLGLGEVMPRSRFIQVLPQLFEPL